MKPFKADIQYFNSRYWSPNLSESVKASDWRIAGHRAFNRAKKSHLVTRMKPGDKITITLTCLKPLSPSRRHPMTNPHVCDDDCRSNGCSNRFNTDDNQDLFLFIECCKGHSISEMHPCMRCGSPIPPQFVMCPDEVCGMEDTNE